MDAERDRKHLQVHGQRSMCDNHALWGSCRSRCVLKECLVLWADMNGKRNGCVCRNILYSRQSKCLAGIAGFVAQYHNRSTVPSDHPYPIPGTGARLMGNGNSNGACLKAGAESHGKSQSGAVH